MSDNALDRIQKLIRLALHNPNDTEAAAAALKACRLIDEHKVTLRLPRIDMYESVQVNIPGRPERWEPFTATWGQQVPPSWQPKNYTPPPPLPVCLVCHQPIVRGQPVFVSGLTTVHSICAKEAVLREQQQAAQQAAVAYANTAASAANAPHPFTEVFERPKATAPETAAAPWWKRVFA